MLVSFAANVLVALITGFATSWATVWFLDWNRERRLKKTFSQLDGEYETYGVDGAPFSEDWLVSFRYERRGVIRVCARYERESREWRGTVKMDADAPQSGRGFYSHVDRPDCGTLQIYVDEQHDRIFVHWTNMSHAVGIPKSGPYFLKKKLSYRAPTPL